MTLLGDKINGPPSHVWSLINCIAAQDCTVFHGHKVGVKQLGIFYPVTKILWWVFYTLCDPRVIIICLGFGTSSGKSKSWSPMEMQMISKEKKFLVLVLVWWKMTSVHQWSPVPSLFVLNYQSTTCPWITCLHVSLLPTENKSQASEANEAMKLYMNVSTPSMISYCGLISAPLFLGHFPNSSI